MKKMLLICLVLAGCGDTNVTVQQPPAQPTQQPVFARYSGNAVVSNYPVQIVTNTNSGNTSSTTNTSTTSNTTTTTNTNSGNTTTTTTTTTTTDNSVNNSNNNNTNP